jgi:hypothetical protein
MMPIILPPPSNPFATRFVRPGAIPFLFPPAIDAERLVARLAELNWRGAIVGPHGSGKSTLLESLRPELSRAGRRVVHFALHDGERSLPPTPRESRSWNKNTVVIVDGYEQLSVWNRWRLERRQRRIGCGLLVTSHGPTRLPELYRSAVDCELLERIVERVVELQTCFNTLGAMPMRAGRPLGPPAGRRGHERQRGMATQGSGHGTRQFSIEAPLGCDARRLILADDVRRAFSLHGQNAREALFALYDLQECRLREARARS